MCLGYKCTFEKIRSLAKVVPALLVLASPCSILRAMSTKQSPVAVEIVGAGFSPVNGIYDSAEANADIPAGFVKTCVEMGWDSQEMWKKLYDTSTPWFTHRDNDSYIYRNKGDGRWWIDGPSGAGVYIVPSRDKLPPSAQWVALDKQFLPVPQVSLQNLEQKGL